MVTEIKIAIKSELSIILTNKQKSTKIYALNKVRKKRGLHHSWDDEKNDLEFTEIKKRRGGINFQNCGLNSV